LGGKCSRGGKTNLPARKKGEKKRVLSGGGGKGVQDRRGREGEITKCRQKDICPKIKRATKGEKGPFGGERGNLQQRAKRRRKKNNTEGEGGKREAPGGTRSRTDRNRKKKRRCIS